MESSLRNFMRKFGVKLAPLRLPLERRLQTLGVLTYLNLVFVIPTVGALLILIGLFTPLWIFSVGYMIWVVYDMYIAKTTKKGGRRSKWMRESRLTKWIRDYFPITLVKSADLPVDKNYILGTHPHGIFSIGTFDNFASEATGFGKKFPGIRCHLCTLTQNLFLPFVRAYGIWMGVCDVSKESIEWILTKQGVGNAAVIVIGGAEEALEARPGNYKLTLLRRKGFIKMALKTGASLVPVFSFGENDIYNQAENPEGSKLRKFQETVKKITGISPPIFYGRGVFNYTFGFLPHRKPINTVVGSPIHLDKDSNPSGQKIDEYHQKYMDELSKLFDEYKVKFGIPEETKLVYV